MLSRTDLQAETPCYQKVPFLCVICIVTPFPQKVKKTFSNRGQAKPITSQPFLTVGEKTQVTAAQTWKDMEITARTATSWTGNVRTVSAFHIESWRVSNAMACCYFCLLEQKLLRSFWQKDGLMLLRTAPQGWCGGFFGSVFPLTWGRGASSGVFFIRICPSLFGCYKRSRLPRKERDQSTYNCTETRIKRGLFSKVPLPSPALLLSLWISF